MGPAPAPNQSRAIALKSRLLLVVALALVTVPTVSADAATAQLRKPEHVAQGRGTHGSHADSFAISPALRAQLSTAAAPGSTTVSPHLTTAPGAFLTRPYMGWHSLNSWFDHCLPDYSVDGKLCTVDGLVALKSNGYDPSFPKGYAATPHGTDYVYYDGHNGFDIGLTYEELLSAAPGVVTVAGTDPSSYNSCFGQTVVIDHGNGISTRYAHMSQVDIAVGAHVLRGQHIGISGTSGCSTGPHLHFGVYTNDNWNAIDPWGWLGTGTDPWPYDLGDMWLTGNPMDPVPTAPVNVTVAASAVGAVVSWSPPDWDGGGIVSYNVTESPDNQVLNLPATARSATFAKLSAGVTHTFAVAARTDLRQGPSAGPTNSIARAPRPESYSILTDGGGIYSFGDARYWGNLIDHNYPGPAVSLAGTPSGNGYSILTSFGGIYTFGDGRYYGNLIDHGYPGQALSHSYTPTGNGYAILTDDGSVRVFGDARYFGNLRDHNYPGQAVSLSYTPTGLGYSILTDSGALYTFGDAQYLGNLIDHNYPGPAVSLEYTGTGRGYNILTSFGGIYSFGDARYYGNLIDHNYPGVAVSIARTP